MGLDDWWGILIGMRKKHQFKWGCISVFGAPIHEKFHLGVGGGWGRVGVWGRDGEAGIL